MYVSFSLGELEEPLLLRYFKLLYLLAYAVCRMPYAVCFFPPGPSVLNRVRRMASLRMGCPSLSLEDTPTYGLLIVHYCITIRMRVYADKGPCH